MQTSRQHLPALTGLRFVAALHVVLYHAKEVCHFLPGPAFNILAVGNLGVNLFFILSGFVLTYTYVDPRVRISIDLRSFWAARFARIYPLYILAFIMFGPKMLLDFHGAGTTLLTGISYVTLTQSWTGMLTWNLPAWSLSAEAFFYLAFPILATVLPRLNRLQLSLCLAFTWAISLIPPALYMMFGEHKAWLAVVMYNPLLRLPEFFAGMILGYLFLLRPSTRMHLRGWHFATAGSILIAAVLMARADSLPWIYLNNGLIDPIFWCLVYGLAVGGYPASALSNRRLILLGEASYGIYILQYPVSNWLKALASLAMSGTLAWGYELSRSFTFQLFYIPLLIGVSIVTLRCIEIPMRRGLRRLLAPKRLVVSSLPA